MLRLDFEYYSKFQEIICATWTSQESIQFLDFDLKVYSQFIVTGSAYDFISLVINIT